LALVAVGLAWAGLLAIDVDLAAMALLGGAVGALVYLAFRVI